LAARFTSRTSGQPAEAREKGERNHEPYHLSGRGLIAGALASYIMGRQQDLLVNLLIGIIGAVVGGLLAGLLGLGAHNLIGEIIIATVGAIVCILVWQRMR
jgi:uncharacterized membrane protein YeaQ/YmgE (transglycosylase-associated protein family)